MTIAVGLILVREGDRLRDEAAVEGGDERAQGRDLGRGIREESRSRSPLVGTEEGLEGLGVLGSGEGTAAVWGKAVVTRRRGGVVAVRVVAVRVVAVRVVAVRVVIVARHRAGEM